jgi:hypothetical protein
VKFGASGDGRAFLCYANFDFSFSQSSTAQVARNLEQKRSGSITLTEARCATMKAQLRGINFHQSVQAYLFNFSFGHSTNNFVSIHHYLDKQSEDVQASWRQVALFSYYAIRFSDCKRQTNSKN